MSSLKINKEDLQKILQLIKTSKVEYGGTLKKIGNTFYIDKLYKGTKYGVNIKDKTDYIFHIHTQQAVNENCGYNFPSLSDIENIVLDKINYGVKYHLIFTPIQTFIIESKRDKPFYPSQEIAKAELDMCDGIISINSFIKKLKDKNILIS